MNKLTTKGLVMTAIVFLSTAFATGFPVQSSQWIVLGLVFLGTMSGYIGQSALFPGTSVQGDINLRDVFKSLFISASNVLSTLGAAEITSTAINWGDMAKNILMLTFGYLAKQAISPAPKSTV